ncbi:MAG: hypothetical protein U0234_23135 [Sandaracinus sp.]
MRGRGDVWAFVATMAVLLLPASVRAQRDPDAVTWNVPCGDRWAFVAGVAELGGSFDGFEVEVEVAPTQAAAFLGRLRIARAGETLAVRELEDENCADVVDALVITAALTLRSLPAAPAVASPPPSDPPPASDDEVPPPIAAPLDPPPPAPPRFGIGASFRGGLGPAPGVALAPAVGLVLEIERVVVTAHFSYWPEAGATLADGRRGVALWALASTLELGYRIGDEVSFVPSVALEPSVAVARGVGVASPRSEATFVLDGGAAAMLTWDLDRVRLFLRADVLFGLVQPVYGVEGEAVFSGPIVRGTGGAGLFVFF